MSGHNPFRPSRPYPAAREREQDLERLRRLTNFESTEELEAWLESDGVDPFFREFRADYLSDYTYAPEADFNEAMGAFSANEGNRYAEADPDKRDWTAVDHYARFMVQVVWYALSNPSPWDGAGEPELAMVGNVLYEVLKYLTKVWWDANRSPLDYDSE